MESLLKNTSSFESELLELKDNLLTLKGEEKKIPLSKYQHHLLVCLINKINSKDDIIRYLWGECDYRKKENGYNQLVFQLRRLIIRSGISTEVLITLPRYGLCLNPQLLVRSHSDKADMKNIVNDHIAYL
ncbi:hypothetical protein AB1287_00860 [Enterobacter asburiae]|uniref:winged helix-turn-helix domain-containing protein n=1 Tax=Scandinavium sp. UTDF21-P1B TaxID=3446379 RepID=UPI00346BF5DB